jgi:hypothetical protein
MTKEGSAKSLSENGCLDLTATAKKSIIKPNDNANLSYN